MSAQCKFSLSLQVLCQSPKELVLDFCTNTHNLWRDKGNSHENIAWSEMGKQNTHAQRSITSLITEEIAFAICFSALHFMWLPQDSKADNVRCYYNLRHQTLTFCYPISQQSRDVKPRNRFFQTATYERAYVRIKARLHRRFLSQQLDAIFLSQQNRIRFQIRFSCSRPLRYRGDKSHLVHTCDFEAATLVRQKLHRIAATKIACVNEP